MLPWIGIAELNGTVHPLQGAYALCRVIKRHEAGLLQGEPAAKAKGASNGAGARAQMSKVSSSSSLVSSEQLSAFTPTNSSPPPPTLDISNTFQVQIPQPPLVQTKPWKDSHSSTDGKRKEEYFLRVTIVLLLSMSERMS
jgi:hypothetical protein